MVGLFWYEAKYRGKDLPLFFCNVGSDYDGYKDIIDNNIVKETQASREVAEVVNSLIGKKEF